MAAAKATSLLRDDATVVAAHRERRGRTIMLNGLAAFAATVLAGTCLAIGIAIGQRVDRYREHLHARRRGFATPERRAPDARLLGQNSLS